MTSRERLFAVLDGRQPDRVPIWLLFPYHRTSYYADVRNNSAYSAVFEESKRCAVMLDRRGFHVSTFGPEVEHIREKSEEVGWEIQRQVWRYGELRLTSELKRREGVTVTKKFLETEEDLETLLRFPVNTDAARIKAEMDRQLPQYLTEKAEFPKDYGSMMLDLGEPINFLYHCANLEEYAVWSIRRSDDVVRFLGRMMEQKRIVYRYCLERGLADVFFLVGSELASPPLVSRKTFQKWVVPYAGELISMIHSSGKKAIQHYHGQIKTILPDFLTMAPDGLHTIEAPPVGDCTFTEAFEVVKDRIALIGNIQYDCFRSYTPEEMAEAVRGVIAECRGKRLILSPSAGPYEEDISETMVANYLQFMRTGWECGKL